MLINLHNIVVYIKDEAMLQEARLTIETNGFEVNDSMFKLNEFEQLNYLYYHKHRCMFQLGPKVKTDTEITLPELEQLLKQKRDDQSK